MAQRAELPLEAFTSVWRWENLGEVPNVLADTVVWLDEDSQREADQNARAVLADQGLISRSGLHPELRQWVTVLARPEVEFYGWITGPQLEISVLATATRNMGILLVRDTTAETVRVHPVHPDGLRDALIAQLPPVPAGHGRSLSVPEADMREQPARRGRHAEEETGFAGFAAASGHNTGTHPDVRFLRELMAQPRTGGGQLYAARRTTMGTRKRIERPVVYLDTATGRWLTQLRRNPSGDGWIVAAPATPQLIASRLHEALQAVG